MVPTIRTRDANPVCLGGKSIHVEIRVGVVGGIPVGERVGFGSDPDSIVFIALGVNCWGRDRSILR